MKLPRILSLILAMLVLAGCGGNAGVGGGLFASATPLPTAQIAVTRWPDPQSALQSFLEAWKAENYAGMYALLTQDSQKSISADDFASRYRKEMNSLTLKELDYSVGATTKNPDNARVNFQMTYKTNMVGDLQRSNSADLRLEAGQWRIVWDDGLILPELHGGNHLAMDTVSPARGNIYDRSGTAIVTQSDAMALGVIPGNVDPKTEPVMLAILGSLTGLYPGTISSLYANAGPDWYIPVGEAKPNDINHSGILGFSAVQETPYNTRLYANGVAPQAIGYVSPIQKDELDHYLRLGYSQGTLVGRIGIEKWGENYLAGKPGGTLYVVSKDGTILSKLGQRDPQPASSITLTIDENLQFQAQKAIEGFRGAIVVIERDSGRVLAMASSPGYDPNFFDPKNVNNNNGITNLLNNPNTPLVDRASQGKYPLGSVFKVITFSAALESGTYTTKTPYNCGYHFDELGPEHILNDWTWEHYQNQLAAGATSFTQPSGPLDLTGGLMRSCDPYFWHIGKDLYDQGRVTAVSNMARGFGLGAPTGIGEVEEEAGTIEDPASEIDAVNGAIGQGTVQVTPLQVARMMAAIGNGGTLYRPQLVEKITDPNGVVTQVFKPDANAKPLPITKATLDALQYAMLQVIRNPLGTAYGRFYNIKQIAIYGKTGTAESGSGNSHAWFAGYTAQNAPGKPDIAIAVIAENAGEGSVVAAPMFKRMVEVYFEGRVLSPYPWETSIGVTQTPTVPVTPTFTP